MPGRIILLTCDELPCHFDHSPCADPAVSEVCHWLSARAATFENHYLQNVGLRNFWSNLSPVLRTAEAGQSVILVSPQTAAGLKESGPDGMELHEIPASEANGLQALRRALQADSHRLCWWHMDGRLDDSAAAMFQEAVELTMESVRNQDDILIVTSLFGTECEQAKHFDSILCESWIRVPLWLCIPSISAVRIPDITGSDDIVATIEALLNSERSDLSEPQPSRTGIDLRQDIPERTLRIVCGDVIALRSAEFLFVQRRQELEGVDTGYDHGDQALYRKPEDIWNINDVSSEYIEAAEALETELNSN